VDDTCADAERKGGMEADNAEGEVSGAGWQGGPGEAWLNLLESSSDAAGKATSDRRLWRQFPLSMQLLKARTHAHRIYPCPL